MKLFCSIILILFLPFAAHAESAREIPVGGTIRDATLHQVDGGTRKLSDYRGKPLIINIWASWCGPCRSEMGSLNRLASEYSKGRFNVIGVSTDDDLSMATSFLSGMGLKFDNYFDSRRFDIERMFGARALPMTVLISADGVVLEKVRGAVEWDKPEVVRAIIEGFSE